MEIRQLGITDKKILVADDDKNMRFLLSYFLTTEGFEVVTATDGEEAWKIFLEDVYDLVITDFQMPGINGLRLAANIKERRPGTTVILMSGFDLEQIQDTSESQNIDHFLPKPFKGNEMREIVLRTFDTVLSVHGG